MRQKQRMNDTQKGMVARKARILIDSLVKKEKRLLETTTTSGYFKVQYLPTWMFNLGGRNEIQTSHMVMYYYNNTIYEVEEFH
jgi:hypothetical protein